MKRAISLICALILVLTVFSSCGYRIKIEKVEKNEASEHDSTTPQGSEENSSALPLQTEPATDSSLEQAGIVPEKGFRLTGMDKQAVLELYTNAMNNVKIRCPGFTRKEYQEISDVVAGNGNINLANKIVNLVAHELLVSSGDSNSQLKVSAHDDLKVRASFPIYGEEYGCKVSDLSIIKSASCLTDGKQYKIIITFNEQHNPEPKKCDYGNIMTPIAREKVATAMQTYVVVLSPELFKYDFTYVNSEIICYIDAVTGAMNSLTQKMQINVDIDLDINIGAFTTNIVKANGSLVNHLEFTDFDWTI